MTSTPGDHTQAIHEELVQYLRARVPLILLVTVEEQRALQLLDEVRTSRDPGSDLITWDMAAGFTSAAGRELPNVKRPAEALDRIHALVKESPRRRDLYVLKDFHEIWTRDVQVRRHVRNLAQQLVFTGASLVVTAPSRVLPEELGDETVVIDLPLPDVPALRRELDRLVGAAGETGPGADHRTTLAQAALGLTATQARRAFAKAMVRDGALDERGVDAVLREKKAAIRQNGALEYYSASETPDDVGGLNVLKSWLALRERAFGREAAEFGLPAPKGMALIGIPGTGKSLIAKMVGGVWRVPLLRLDVGALYASLVGESEERLRHAMRLAETVAPCVLWIDELEKALGGGGERSSGVSQRILGSLLTWMQEKTAPVFVVATANDVSAIPPETLRRGRFDEVFFLDLPTEEERREIITVHLRKRRRDPARFDVFHLARESDGFTGAELEQAVIDALYLAFAENRDIRTDDLTQAVARTVPLNTSHAEAIKKLRGWLEDGRAQSASTPQPAAAPDSSSGTGAYL